MHTTSKGFGLAQARPQLARHQLGRSAPPASLRQPRATGLDEATSASTAPTDGRSASDSRTVTSSTSIDYPDPESRYKRYGKFFGGGYKWTNLLQDVPRVRVRTSETRRMNELLDLAVLNERLAGRLEPWEARSKLEWLKMRNKALGTNWSYVYDYITSHEVTATLAVIEEAYEKVRVKRSWGSSHNHGFLHQLAATLAQGRTRSATLRYEGTQYSCGA